MVGDINDREDGAENVKNVLEGMGADTVTSIVDITLVMRPVFAYGNVPLMSTAAGVTALAISTILLAVASELLRAEVWISCVLPLVGMVTLSFLPTRLVFPAALSWFLEHWFRNV